MWLEAVGHDVASHGMHGGAPLCCSDEEAMPSVQPALSCESVAPGDELGLEGSARELGLDGHCP